MQVTQKGRSWCSQKIPRGQGTDQVVEPEAGRRIQTQVINLVIGVVPCPSRITHATSDRVGSCGTKLLNGFKRTPVAGRSTASLPVRAQWNRSARTRQASVSSVKGSATAVGSLLKSWTRKCLKSKPVSGFSFLRHCSASEAVGSLTMRCSEPGGGVAVAIVASRAPGR